MAKPQEDFNGKRTVLYVNYRPEVIKGRRKLDGIRRFAGLHGWAVETLENSAVAVGAIEEALCAIRPAGVVVDASTQLPLPSPHRFGRVPVVYLDPPMRLPWRAPCVVVDNAAVVSAAFRELSAGLPPCYAAVDYFLPRRWASERIAAFRKLCSGAGSGCAVFACVSGESDGARARRMALWAERLPLHSAIFAVNDRTAYEMSDALAAAGRSYPRSVTLVGVDGNVERDTDISSVRLDFERAGFFAARLLASAPPSGGGDARVLVEPLLVDRRKSTGGHGRRERFVMDAVSIIRAEACGGLTAVALAAWFPCSRKHFDRRFREATGHSVLDEILHVRFETACSMLLDGEVPVSAIANFCGFPSYMALRKLFRQRFGMSMTVWRRRHSRGEFLREK